MSKVLVTGANGYLAGEIVRQLLELGHLVRGTVRGSTDDQERIGHLLRMPGAEERLELVRIDSLEDESALMQALKDVTLVLHTASPLGKGIENSEAGYVQPAVRGTETLLRAVEANTQVERVVLTSSISAICTSGPDDHIFNELDWSPEETLREKEKWYALSKTKAERAFWAWSELHPAVSCASVCPGLILGPISNRSHADGTVNRYVKMLENGKDAKVEVPNRGTVPCDVRDVARTHILALVNDESAGKRYAVVTLGPKPPQPLSHMDCVQALVRAGAPLDPCLANVKYERGVDLWNVERAEKLLGGFTSIDDTMAGMFASFKTLNIGGQ